MVSKRVISIELVIEKGKLLLSFDLREVTYLEHTQILSGILEITGNKVEKTVSYLVSNRTRV